MGLKNSIEELDLKLGKKLHEIVAINGEKVFFYLANISDALYYQKDLDNLDLSRATVKVALSRSRDEEGRLVWETEAERSELVQNSKQLDLLKDIGSKILQYESKLIGTDLLKTARKN